MIDDVASAVALRCLVHVINKHVLFLYHSSQCSLYHDMLVARMKVLDK